jgi:hypothetical protein
MTTASVIAALCLPADARVDQRVPKKMLVENGAPTAADKRQINDGIEELHWLAALKPGTIGVPVFRDDAREYLEIAVLSLTVRPGAKAHRLTELIHRAIPFPVFLIVLQPNGLMLSLAHLRWSQGQAGQTVIDGTLVTATLNSDQRDVEAFLASLNIIRQPRDHLRALYQGWIQCFEALSAAQLSGAYTLCESPSAYQTRREALTEHQGLSREISFLRARAAKETQLNRRVELNIEVKRLETKLAQTLAHF